MVLPRVTDQRLDRESASAASSVNSRPQNARTLRRLASSASAANKARNAPPTSSSSTPRNSARSSARAAIIATRPFPSAVPSVVPVTPTPEPQVVAAPGSYTGVPPTKEPSAISPVVRRHRTCRATRGRASTKYARIPIPQRKDEYNGVARQAVGTPARFRGSDKLRKREVPTVKIRLLFDRGGPSSHHHRRGSSGRGGGDERHDEPAHGGVRVDAGQLRNQRPRPVWPNGLSGGARRLGRCSLEQFDPARLGRVPGPDRHGQRAEFVVAWSSSSSSSSDNSSGSSSDNDGRDGHRHPRWGGWGSGMGMGMG